MGSRHQPFLPILILASPHFVPTPSPLVRVGVRVVVRAIVRVIMRVVECEAARVVVRAVAPLGTCKCIIIGHTCKRARACMRGISGHACKRISGQTRALARASVGALANAPCSRPCNGAMCPACKCAGVRGVQGERGAHTVQGVPSKRGNTRSTRRSTRKTRSARSTRSTSNPSNNYYY